MFSRRPSRLVVAGAAFAVSIAGAGPASASVRYDPGTKTGFVDESDARKAFGWTDAMLASKAAGLVFDHDFWTDDTYAVACGRDAFPVVHHRDFGRYELAGTVVRDARRGAPIGYHGRLRGFRLTGPYLGISGTSVPPAVGQPCPESKDQGPAIDRVRLVSTTTGWSLTVSSGDVSHRLLAGESRTAGSGGQAAAGERGRLPVMAARP
jgi:hypothetical protein